MKRYEDSEVREILSSMIRGNGYFDFNIVEVCFNSNGEFKIYHRDKLRTKTKSMKEAVRDIGLWFNI